MKMELPVSSETSALKAQTPGDYPKDTIQHSTRGENLKSRKTGLTPDLMEWQGEGRGGTVLATSVSTFCYDSEQLSYLLRFQKIN